MNTMKNRRKVITLILLLAVIALVGTLLYLKTLEQRALDFRVKVGLDEFPVIFEDGDYENLNKAGLIWTVNNLFEYVNNFEITQKGWYDKYSVNGREVESNLYLNTLSSGYRPDIQGNYTDIIEEDGVYHLVLTRKFIEAYIEASKYEEVTSELNTFIDRLNRIKSADPDTLSEAEIDSMLFIDPKFSHNPDLEEKRIGLREFALDAHFQSTNVFWIGESEELGRYLHGDNAESMIIGEMIYYTREGNLPSWFSDDPADFDALPPHRTLILAYIPIQMQNPLSGCLLTRGISSMIIDNGK